MGFSRASKFFIVFFIFCLAVGCILVGENLKVGMVLNSNAWVERLKKKIVEAKDRGEGVWITIE